MVNSLFTLYFGHDILVNVEFGKGIRRVAGDPLELVVFGCRAALAFDNLRDLGKHF